MQSIEDNVESRLRNQLQSLVCTAELVADRLNRFALRRSAQGAMAESTLLHDLARQLSRAVDDATKSVVTDR